MSSKTLSLNTFIPQISSTTKTNSEPLRARRAVKADSKPRKIHNNSWVSFVSAASLALAVVGLGFYIYTINASVSKGYELKHEQAIMTQLEEAQKRLVVQQAALGSIVKVNDLASTAGMVPATGAEFLSANQLSAR